MTDQKINRRTAIKKTVNSGAALGALASMPPLGSTCASSRRAVSTIYRYA